MVHGAAILVYVLCLPLASLISMNYFVLLVVCTVTIIRMTKVYCSQNMIACHLKTKYELTIELYISMLVTVLHVCELVES